MLAETTLGSAKEDGFIKPKKGRYQRISKLKEKLTLYFQETNNRLKMVLIEMDHKMDGL